MQKSEGAEAAEQTYEEQTDDSGLRNSSICLEDNTDKQNSNAEEQNSNAEEQNSNAEEQNSNTERQDSNIEELVKRILEKLLARKKDEETDSSGKKTGSKKAKSGRSGTNKSKTKTTKRIKEDKTKIYSSSKQYSVRDYHAFIENQLRKLDYTALFSYLGSLKLNIPEYEELAEQKRQELFRKYETIEKEKAFNFVEEYKYDQIMGVSRTFEMSDDREAYKWFRTFNWSLTQFWYDLALN